MTRTVSALMQDAYLWAEEVEVPVLDTELSPEQVVAACFVTDQIPRFHIDVLAEKMRWTEFWLRSPIVFPAAGRGKQGGVLSEPASLSFAPGVWCRETVSTRVTPLTEAKFSNAIPLMAERDTYCLKG